MNRKWKSVTVTVACAALSQGCATFVPESQDSPPSDQLEAGDERLTEEKPSNVPGVLTLLGIILVLDALGVGDAK